MNATINGITLAFDDAGSGPAVVLIHGFPLCRRMWRPQAALLAAAGFRVVTPDLRGFGESDAPEGPYSMGLFADDLVGLLDQLGIERAVVGGMSMGGYVLMNLLERHPERVSAACFLLTRSNADDEAGKARRLALAREVLSAGPRAVAEAFVPLLFAPATLRERPELVAEVRGWMEATDPQGLAGGLLAMRERKEYTPLLDRFRLPALVIGATEDRAVPPEVAAMLQQGLPDSTLCMIPGGGHLANLEKPEAFNRCLLEFLTRTTAGG